MKCKLHYTTAVWGRDIFKVAFKSTKCIIQGVSSKPPGKRKFVPNLCFMSLKKVNLRPILHESLCTKVYLNNKNTDIGC